jgi:hypothetical protein
VEEGAAGWWGAGCTVGGVHCVRLCGNVNVGWDA